MRRRVNSLKKRLGLFEDILSSGSVWMMDLRDGIVRTGTSAFLLRNRFDDFRR